MDDDHVTLAELAETAGVTTRTVRYYISQGLLPSPGHGPGARYGQGHAARLRAIRRLQQEHLPLAEIRHRLVGLPDEAISRLGAAPAPTESLSAGRPSSAIDYIRGLLGDGPHRGVRDDAAVPPPPLASLVADARPGAPPPGQQPAPASMPRYLALSADGGSRGPDAAVSREPERSQWDRIALSPDVELHIRRPLSRIDNRRVERLLDHARAIFEEDHR